MKKIDCPHTGDCTSHPERCGKCRNNKHRDYFEPIICPRPQRIIRDPWVQPWISPTVKPSWTNIPYIVKGNEGGWMI